jgi:hypothetical protein
MKKYFQRNTSVHPNPIYNLSIQYLKFDLSQSVNLD